MNEEKQGEPGRPRRSRARPGGWTDARRRLFLATLAATGEVPAALRAAGVTAAAARALRGGDPAFADLRAQALDIGYQRLEEQLLCRALGALKAAAVGADAPAAPVPPSGERGLPAACRLALALLARRDASAAARGAPAAAHKRMGTQEVDAILARKLDALAASRARQGGRGAPPANRPAPASLTDVASEAA